MLGFLPENRSFYVIKMKQNLFLFNLIITQFIIAQVTPIEKLTDIKQTSYRSASYESFFNLYEKQSYDLMYNLSENLQLIDTVNIAFINNCLEQKTLDEIDRTKTHIYLNYIVNQNGKVMSCSLVNYGYNQINFSDSELACILMKGMEHSFSFVKMPTNVKEFYIIVKKIYKLQ